MFGERDRAAVAASISRALDAYGASSSSVRRRREGEQSPVGAKRSGSVRGASSTTCRSPPSRCRCRDMHADGGAVGPACSRCGRHGRGDVDDQQVPGPKLLGQLREARACWIDPARRAATISRTPSRRRPRASAGSCASRAVADRTRARSCGRPRPCEARCSGSAHSAARRRSAPAIRARSPRAHAVGDVFPGNAC